MILENKVNITITPFYKKLLKLSDYCLGETYSVNVVDLPKYSTVKVFVRCDVCGKKKNIQYRNYLKSKNNKEYYSCSSVCSTLKKEETCMIKFGCKCSLQNNYVRNKSKKTKLDKYGNENYINIEKIKKTKLDKYGNENYNNIEKIKKTMLERYGVEYTFQSKKLKNKSKETCIFKYGVDEILKDKKIRAKIKNTNLIKYGVVNPMMSQEISSKSKNKKLNKTVEKYSDIGVIDNKGTYVTLYCDICQKNIKIKKDIFFNRLRYKTILYTKCNPINSCNKSGMEIQLLEFIKDNYYGEIIENSKELIEPYELDIYLPHLNLAFEFNGLYWHNELHKPIDYHKVKTDLCEEKGVQLIHIWEDDWIYKQDIIKSIILNKLGKIEKKIFTTKYDCKKVNDDKLIKKFLNENHIHGFVESDIKLGLFYNSELVSLMCFNKQKTDVNDQPKDDYELVRFCNKTYTNIVESNIKLLNYFIKKYDFSQILYQVDRSYFNSDINKKMGFKFIAKTIPDYHYILNGNRIYEYDYSKIDSKIINGRKIYKIYNAGNLKYKLNKI
jgi:hypothetical protein